MKRVLLITALLISLTGAGQHYIQASIQQGSTSNSVNIMFSPNYTNAPTELVNYLSLSIAIPAASASGVVPALTMTGPFAGLQMIKAIPFSYLQGTDSIYSWVYSSGPSSMSWTTGVPFVGATITFTGGSGSSKVKLVDFTNKSGGANSNTLYVIVTNNPPFDVANYSNLFYSIGEPNGSTTGTDTESDQYVETNQEVFLSNFCPSPAIPVVTEITATGANITWSPVPGVIGYEIDLSTSPTPTGGSVITGLTYSRNDLAVGTAYYFQIRSICSPGNYSGWVRADFATICPTSTSMATDSITPSGVKIKWDPVAAAGLGYQYAVTSSPGTPSPSAIIPTLIDSVVVSGLTEGTTYYAQVRVNCGPGVYSEWFIKSFTTTYPPCQSPSLVNVKKSNRTIEANWPIVAKALGYEYAITESNVPPFTGFAVSSQNIVTNISKPNSKYYIHVRTKCGQDRFSQWTTQPFISDCFYPEFLPVENVPKPGTAIIKWSSVNGSLGYEYAILSTSTPPGGAMNFITDTILNTTNLIPGNKYFFHVRTVCATSVYSIWKFKEIYAGGISVITFNFSRIYKVNVYGDSRQYEEAGIYDMNGKLIKRIKLNNNSAILNLNECSKGVYIIKLMDNQKYVTKILLL